MKESLKITIEEWAGDNSIKLTESQVDDLCDAIDICQDVDMYSTGFTLGHPAKDPKEDTINALKNQIRHLELYCEKNGHSVSSDPNGVTEFGFRPCGTAHMGSYEDRYVNGSKY